MFWRDGEVGEEGVALEDGGDVALVGGEAVEAGAVEEDVAGGGVFEAGDQAEGGGFAAAGGAEQGEELARRYGEGERVEGDVAGEVLGELVKFQDGAHWFETDGIADGHQRAADVALGAGIGFECSGSSKAGRGPEKPGGFAELLFDQGVVAAGGGFCVAAAEGAEQRIVGERGGVAGDAGAEGFAGGFKGLLAVGLESCQFPEGAVVGALGAAGVEVEGAQVRVEFRCEEGIEMGVEGGGEGGFGEAAAAEGPGGVGELGEEVGFEGAVGLDGEAEIVHEGLEFEFLAGEDDELAGGEAMGPAIGGGFGFALMRAGAGGVLGVGAVGGDLGGGGHGGQVLSKEMKRAARRKVRRPPGGRGLTPEGIVAGGKKGNRVAGVGKCKKSGEKTGH